jgi:hypothetical protein
LFVKNEPVRNERANRDYPNCVTPGAIKQQTAGPIVDVFFDELDGYRREVRNTHWVFNGDTLLATVDQTVSFGTVSSWRMTE